MLRLTSIVVMLLVSLSGMAREEQFDMSASAKNADRVYVKHAHGKLYIEGWDRNEVSVTGVKKGTGRMADQLDRVYVTVEQRGDTIEVIAHRENTSWSWRGGSLSMDLEISVPRALALKFRHAHGSTKIVDIDGDLEGRKSHGKLVARGLGGNVNLDNAHGNVTIDDISGNLVVDTSHGKLSVQNVNGSVRLETAHGSVSLDGIAGAVNARGSHGGISITPSGPIIQDYDINYSHGSINLDIPSDSDATVDMRASHGRIRTDLPTRSMSKKSKRQATAELNEGTARLSLRTTHGSIKVNQI